MICAGISGHFHVEELEDVQNRRNFTLLILLFRFPARERLKLLKVKTLLYTQLDHISDLVTKQVRFQRVRENHVEIGLTLGWGAERKGNWTKVTSLQDVLPSRFDAWLSGDFRRMSRCSSSLLLCLSYKTAPEEAALIEPSSLLEVPMAYIRSHSRLI